MALSQKSPLLLFFAPQGCKENQKLLLLLFDMLDAAQQVFSIVQFSFVDLIPAILQHLFYLVRACGPPYTRGLTYPVCLDNHILDKSSEDTGITLGLILSSISWKEI